MNNTISIGEPWMWAVFIAFVLVMLVLDLFVFGGNKTHKVSVKEAAAWSLVWVTLALLFNAGLWWHLTGTVGPEVADLKALEFITGYLIEKSLSVDNESVPCVNQQGVPQNKPIHYITANAVFCVFEPGFFGRDHGDDDGGPPDSNVITCTGAYPAGGKVDTNPTGPTGNPNFWAPTQQGQGGNGAGIDPIFMSWFTDFMKAEAVLRLGVAGDAKALMVSGANKSINRARSFASSLGQTVPSSVEPSQIAYISNLEALYDASSDKLDVAMKEFYKSLYGNALEAYNMYRRTSSPKNIQPVRAPNPGVFYRSLIYPANFVNLNNSTSQKTANDIKVFWDTNPDVLK